MVFRKVFPFFVAALLLLLTTGLFADSHARIVRLSDVEGSVQIDRNTGQGFEKALMNMPITEGARLKTAAGGRAEVEFENGTVLRLADNSSVEFQTLSLRTDGQRSSEVRIDQGTVYVNYKKKGGDDFRLAPGRESINLNHDRDVHFRLQLQNGEANLAVFKGELAVPDDGKMAKVKKGETLNLDLNDNSKTILAKNISDLSADQWDSQRDDYNAQYTATYNRSRFPYQYGYSDLSYYGSFFDAAGYGTLWRPFGVSAMWDPFGAGAWSYYSGLGYTWVSGYPWGWTPYRYGTWLYVPTYGWAWQPGAWNTWNAYPVVANAPTTWHRPLPPPGTATVRPTVLVGNPTFIRPAVIARPVPRPGMMSMPSGASSGAGAQPSSRTSTASSMSRPGRPSASPSAPAPMPRTTPAPMPAGTRTVTPGRPPR
jgi:Family of unknown function (DUF6600)/FecR protein